jgi:hypothetical protein
LDTWDEGILEADAKERNKIEGGLIGQRVVCAFLGDVGRLMDSLSDALKTEVRTKEKRLNICPILSTELG